MRDPQTGKHFLDTSVARPFVSATTAYKEFLSQQIPGAKYVSPFVSMEFRRSLVRSLIDLYFLLNLDTFPTISEGFKFSSNRYQTRELKAAIFFASELMATRRINTVDSNQKTEAIRALADSIIRMDTIFKGWFRNNSVDGARCARASIPFKVNSHTATRDFQSFASQFDDTTTCRNNCTIDDFLLQKHRTEVDTFIGLAKELPKNSANEGFRRIAAKLSQIVAKGGSKCSCKQCEGIGDAVIALDAPRDVRLEHLDQSFNHLCPPLGQPHQQHQSEFAFTKALQGVKTSSP